MLKHLREQLAKLLTERAALVDAFEATAATATSESRALNETEQSAYDTARSALKAHDEKIVAVRANVKDAEEDEARSANVAAIASEVGQTGTAPESRASGVKVGSEPETYRKGGQASYFRDLMAVNLNRGDMSAAHERLVRNDREARALTTVDGAGGEFVPPLWMVQDYIKLARAGRVVADNLNKQPLPGGTDSISLPRLATGTSTAEQATQNTLVSNTDATTNSVTATVATIAGQQIVAVQLLEQSPVNMDSILLGDLAADYAVRADTFVISNNAANKRGLLNVTGVNAVTYTAAPGTVQGLYPKVADAIQQIHTARFMAPTKIFMHPRRWSWFLAAVDSGNRPLVTPYSAMNPVADVNGVVAEGAVGSLQGLPVYVDANIPTTAGGGTEDRIIVAKADDVILYEGTPKAEAFRETKADQLSVLLRFYNYLALHSERYPKSISVIAGTGLTGTALF